jgi:hypothetical protein
LLHDAFRKHAEKVRRKNGDQGVSPEVLVHPEKSRYCHVTHSEKTWEKPEMGTKVLARKCSSFLKNPDIAA